MTPLISAVIPAYNASRFLDASVGSALGQSLGALEVIVVDDGSTDDTADRLKAWTDPRLRVIRRPHQGIVAAYNAGIREAQGAYIGFLDADDIWARDKLARHARILYEQPGVDATFSWVGVIDRHGRTVRMPRPRWRGTVSFSQLLADYSIRTMSAVVMRRAAAEEAGPFDSSFVRCVDLEFLLRVALLRPDNFCAIPEELSLYRRHTAQRTREWRRMCEGWNQVLASMRVRAPEQTASVERLASSNMHRYFASLAYENGDFKDARDLIRLSFSQYPAAFLRDSRNWKMSAAAAASLSLPKRVLFAVEKMAGFDRSR